MLTESDLTRPKLVLTIIFFGTVRLYWQQRMSGRLRHLLATPVQRRIPAGITHYTGYAADMLLHHTT